MGFDKTNREGVRIKDTGNLNIIIAGKITLTGIVDHRVEAISFYVVERPTTQVLLGCDFCDKHVEAISRDRDLSRWTTIPLFLSSVRPSGRRMEFLSGWSNNKFPRRNVYQHCLL